MNNGKTFTRRVWALIIIGGLLVYCLVGGLTFAVLHHQASERASNTVEYVKKQSLECELVNNANVMKSQIRVMQNASQVARDIEADGGDLSVGTLKRYGGELHLTNVYVLSPGGGLLAGYQDDEDKFEDLKQLVSEEAVLDVASHEKKVYATRVSFDDGSYADFACAKRLDAPGIVAVAYHTRVEYANKFLLTLQSLLDGYRVANDTSVVVEKDGEVIASNAVEKDGETVDEASVDPVVEEIKEKCASGQMRLVKGEHALYYGAYGKTGDYSVYTFTKASRLLHYMASNALVGLTVYAFVIAFFVTNRRRSEHRYLELMLDQKQQYATQLEEAVKVAQKANDAKTEFLQRMSHDLRTPLNGIRGMVEVGNAYADDMQKQAQCRDKVWSASNVLLDLVNEALDMTKLESGKITLEKDVVDFEKVLDDVCDMVERQAKQREVTISRESIDVCHPYVRSSALYLHRLFMNIATNAVKYNKLGGEVFVSHKELTFADGVAVHQVTVTDTGIGMSEEFQKRLFEPFAREEQELDYKPSGTGLGLSIARQLVELMGGTIECDSELGRGTRCTVTIPLEVVEDDEELAVKMRGDEPVSLEGINVLLAEDNELNREVAEFVIASAGGALEVAENGKRALELFESSEPGTFDVILMDIMMPVMDGYEAAGAIRALPREDATEIPIIAVSANAFADDRQRSREVGMNAHLSKPLDSDELVRTINAMTRK